MTGTPLYDVEVTNEGSLVLFRPLSNTGETWLDEHLPEDAPRLGRTIAVEHRYAGDIVGGMIIDRISLDMRL